MLDIEAAQDLQNSFVIQHNCNLKQIRANLTIADLKIHTIKCPRYSYSEETVAFAYCLLLQLIGIEIKQCA